MLRFMAMIERIQAIENFSLKNCQPSEIIE